MKRILTCLVALIFASSLVIAQSKSPVKKPNKRKTITVSADELEPVEPNGKKNELKNGQQRQGMYSLKDLDPPEIQDELDAAVSEFIDERSHGHWKFITADPDMNYFWDSDRFTIETNGNAKAWIKTGLKDSSPFGAAKYVHSRKKEALSTKGFEKFSHSMNLLEFDCKRRQMRTLVQISYDTDGYAISSYENPTAPWSSVIPESTGEDMLTRVCKHVAFKRSKK